MKLSYYYPQNPAVRSIVKYFWTMETGVNGIGDNIMLPVKSIDFVIHYSDSVTYCDSGIRQIPRGFFFSGLRTKPFQKTITGDTKTFGITFYPGTVYSMLNTPVHLFKNALIEVDGILPDFSSRFLDDNPDYDRIPCKLEQVEQNLLKYLNFDLFPDRQYRKIMHSFNSARRDFDIPRYCDKTGIGQRSLERMTNKYLGTSPKGFQRLQRFRRTIRQMLSGDFGDLTTLSQRIGYYDQSHFISDFKTFSQSNPSRFIREKSSFCQKIPMEMFSAQ